MNQISVAAYINFQGRAREAMEFYKNAFGGELTLSAFNPDGPPKPAKENDRILHATLSADGVIIMGSDGMAEYPPTFGDNIAVAISGPDIERLTKIFNSLSEGGLVKGPLKKESWGDTLGWLEDKFGINWMINIAKD